MIPVVVILSFLLEILFSNLVSSSGLFIPLFFLVTLVIIYPYFKSKSNYIIICLICGLLYDLGFLNTAFVNTLCFTFTGLFIMFLHSYINYNIVSTSIVNIISIVFYRIINYLLLCLVAYTNFNILISVKGIYSSLIVNILYGIILYLLLEFISKRFNIKKSE